MNRHIVLVGGGRVGQHVAEQLSPARNTVTIVERDPQKCDELDADANRVIEGDGTDLQTFGSVDLSAVDIVAALTNDTRTNLTVCELAKDGNPDTVTLLRIARDGEQDYGHRSFVDHVVYPAAAGAAVTVDQISAL
ncbi:potassium channel family protein [Halovenus marina]|jgi:trk system potassium uptake protein TrkA|uniref:potassium channel family protein n=1 Tax=Halovenus marina TaxID=3396621 RepID=UPI003F56B715